MVSHDGSSNSNDLKLAAIRKFGVTGMRWGERALKNKLRHDQIVRTNALAKQARIDAATTSTIADAMEAEVRGNRRRTRTEREQHILALKDIHSRMFHDGVDARMLLQLIQSNSMISPQNFKPAQSAKGAIALHGDTGRPSGSQILAHAEFLRKISGRLEATARKFNDEVENAQQYFIEGSSVLKPVRVMSDEELIHHFK